MDKDKIDSGVYVLEIFLYKPKKIEIGAKSIYTFPPGYYYYCGSAQKNLQARLERHKSKQKNNHWHIDYLLEEAYLKNYYTWQSGKKGECVLADYFQNNLKGRIIVKGFGSSDCKCISHLFYFQNKLDNKEIPGGNFFRSGNSVK